MRFREVKEFGRPYVIAEIGANHNGDMELAKKMISIAKKCGADAAKFQSWSKDTIFSKKVYDDNYFLRDDYRNRKDFTLEQIVDKYHIGNAQHHELKEYCDTVGIDFVSTPFSKPEVDLLVELEIPFIKIASMDLNNIPFLKYVASKEVPVAISTGLCGLADVSDAVNTLRSNGCDDVYLLHCVSIYPPQDEQVNLNNIDLLRMAFNLPIGYSDHTLGTETAIASVALGAKLVEKHLTLKREDGGVDAAFSMEAEEFAQMVKQIRNIEKALGAVNYNLNSQQRESRMCSRSLFVVKDIRQGEIFTQDNIRSIRPGTGLHTKYYEDILGKKARMNLEKGMPMKWNYVDS